MVTLRSEAKQATALTLPNAHHSKGTAVTACKTARRSSTPDRGSQDSGLRRSQRVRDRHGALESIQEDTAASAEALSEEHDIDLAKQGATEAISEPAQTRAQAVQQATLQASDSITGSIPLHVPTQDDQSSAEDSDSETNDDLLAKLSQSMFAALRPKAGSMDAGYRAVESSTAETDSLRAFQPDVVQPDRQQATQDEHEEEEMHWQPLTGLPEPLTVTDCRSQAAAATRTSQLEKQFKLAPRDTRSLDRQAAKLAPKTAGKQWYDLPAQQMTDDTKRDLKLLQLRGTFDPKRFYKSSDHKKGLPKFFQVGTVVESSADFYSGRLSNKERKRTITEELLADPDLSQARKRRFDKLQDERAYWANKRGRKTDLPRGKKISRSKK